MAFVSSWARALAVAASEAPLLRMIEVNAGGMLVLSGEGQGQLNKRVPLKERVVLMEHLLGLLVTFIGEGLTVRLMGEIWPNLMLGHPQFDGENLEKTYEETDQADEPRA